MAFLLTVLCFDMVDVTIVSVDFQSNDRPWADKQWALCVWDDVLEHCGPVSPLSLLCCRSCLVIYSTLLHFLLCCWSCIVIHSHIHFFTSCCAADHGYRYTHSFTHCCVSNDAYSLTHWYVSNHVYSICIHFFTHCCQITHTDTLTHSLHSLPCVKSWIQIYSHTHFTHCCQITHTNTLTHTHTTHCCLSNHAYIYTLTHTYLQNC